MRPHLETLQQVSPRWISCHPNAGLPNAFGEYDEQPCETADFIKEFATSGFVNIVGGCCGTTPAHIAAVAKAVAGATPRKTPMPDHLTRWSGLEMVTVRPESNFVMVGERTNVTGSRKFMNLIKANDYGKALEVVKPWRRIVRC